MSDPVEDREYRQDFIRIVSDPRFRVMGFTMRDLNRLRSLLDAHDLAPKDVEVAVAMYIRASLAP